LLHSTEGFSRASAGRGGFLVAWVLVFCWRGLARFVAGFSQEGAVFGSEKPRGES
jgi:hypothetical protein